MDHPALTRLQEWWLVKRADRPMPSRHDFHPFELKEILPDLFLVDVLGQPHREFRYRLVGTRIDMLLGMPFTGKCLSELPISDGLSGDPVARIAAHHNRVLEQRRPLAAEHEFTLAGCRRIRTLCLLAPLSNDGTTVNMLIGVLVFLKAHPV